MITYRGRVLSSMEVDMSEPRKPKVAYGGDWAEGSVSEYHPEANNQRYWVWP